MHPYPVTWVATGRAVVYYAHAFSERRKCQHCIYFNAYSRRLSISCKSVIQILSNTLKTFDLMKLILKVQLINIVSDFSQLEHVFVSCLLLRHPSF